jgi:predicted secreted Zn-dependent protease
VNVQPRRRVAAFIFTLVAFLALIILIIVTRRSGPTEPSPVVPSAAAEITRFTDDFSSRSGWATFSSDAARLSYAEGGYRLKLSRPADDALSILLLRGKPLPSIAATAVVTQRGRFGGLVGVGCAAEDQRVYVGAVDPAGSGYVIVRIEERTAKLLQHGGNAEGPIRGVRGENELEMQCRALSGAGSRTSLRLFSNGRLLAAYEDANGLGPFRGMAVGGISLRRPLEAVFSRASLQSLPPGPGTPDARVCDRLVTAGALQAEFAWLVDSGAIRADTVDFDVRHITRLVGELVKLSSDLETDAREVASGGDRAVLQTLAEELQEQRVALSAIGPRSRPQPVDVVPKMVALSCSEPRPAQPPGPNASPSPLSPRTTVAHRSSASRDFDRGLVRDLPAPAFVADSTLPSEPATGVPESPVEVDFRYDTFRVFGSSIDEINESLRIQGINVRGDLVAAATYHELQPFYARNPLASGCALYPKVTLSLLITLPEWEPPPGASRYLINQWNEFLWDLDDHERHHARLWIRAANAMVTAIVGTPPQPRCAATEAIANARIDRVVRRYTERNQKFDRDVAAGKLLAPSLP